MNRLREGPDGSIKEIIITLKEWPNFKYHLWCLLSCLFLFRGTRNEPVELALSLRPTMEGSFHISLLSGYNLYVYTLLTFYPFSFSSRFLIKPYPSSLR